MSELSDDDLENKPEEDPPEPYSTWEEYFEDFDRQLEEAPLITVRERIDNPNIRPADEVPDSELAGELETLIELLHANGIVIEFIHEIEDREAYGFITEELLDETMDDIHSPGMYSHFIYEEFHPNDEDDIELWTGEFMDTFFKEGAEASFLPIGDKELYDADGNPISEMEFRQQMDKFHKMYSIITEYNYEMTAFQIEGDYATVEVETSWAGLNAREQAMLRFQGLSTLRLRRNLDVGWDVIQARIVGWNTD